MNNLYKNNLIGGLTIPADLDLDDDKVTFNEEKVVFDKPEKVEEKKEEPKLKIVKQAIQKKEKKKKIAAKKNVDENLYVPKFETFKRFESRVEEDLYEFLKSTAAQIDENSKALPRTQRFREKVTINSVVRALLSNAQKRISKLDLRDVTSEDELIDLLT